MNDELSFEQCNKDNSFNKDSESLCSIQIWGLKYGIPIMGFVRNGMGSREGDCLLYSSGELTMFFRSVLRNYRESEEFRCLFTTPREDAFSQIREAINGVFFAR